MKKLMIKAVIVLFLITLIAFSLGEKKDKEFVVAFPKIENETRAVFISYLEYQSYLRGCNKEKIEEKLNEMITELDAFGFNTLIVQVRSFSDAIYSSKIFPSSKTIVEKEGDDLPLDMLSFFVQAAHEKGMRVHAWINPYRIRSCVDASGISIKNPCFKWLGTSKVASVDGKGIFYNPGSDEVLELILEGIREILENYDVDGILYDDYFYPSDEIDEEYYIKYQEEGGTLTKEEYHFMRINLLVQKTYELVHSYDKKFGVSPEGNIENNYESSYADVKTWLSNSGYVDYIMPQIYFGFLNERKPYIETLNEWSHLITNEDIALIPALAFYKVGTEDQYALTGSSEWLSNDNIIMKQIIASRAVCKYQGFSLFRYEYLFGKNYETSTTLNELSSLKKLF